MPTRKIYVRIGAAAAPVGELIVDVAGNRETSAFSYDPTWLKSRNAFPLAPHMPLTETPFYMNKAVGGSSLPSPIADGSPDSWGRAIIKAALGGRVTSDLDYLLESDDFLRSGALRYFDGPEAEAMALAPPREGLGGVSVPRLLDLNQVIAEARAFEADPVRYRERRAEMMGGGLLKNAVGSLGGARPKVNALADDGSLWIVKLAKIDDQYAIARAEVMALRLAERVGISASTADVLESGQLFPIAKVKRFDRSGKIRIPFISAQTFMGLPGTDPGNYVDVAHLMLVHSDDPEGDRQELYRRLMFNVLIQNTDDHLRNLGFLYRGNGKWGLSPAFDINPVPEEGTTLKTAISEIHGNALDIEKVVDVAPYFGLNEDEGRTLAAAMATTIRDEWRQIGASVGMTSADFRAISPAMKNSQIERAIQFNVAAVPGATLP
ncbi:type II toxin-antitoxin system HipA family toxin [Microvirga sp. ACRRW]|uniref:type II toxin-antitoxin system HipA family toxin n=1 Tax=Microvirga sp. ACRRW TaxID=2918205 RepID=UPI001EF4BB0D|nr:type II toxin-antitoxin system HipA family toxin [Microvirga sp. ACRRW]MCG7392922.1 type II toxin-antitoxin system HipA family toxin [Microvirga sp. ACRRW]